jgi:tetratricopeptide (TPR) repeat protein
LRNGQMEWKQTAGFEFTGDTPARYALAQPAVILHYIRLAFWPRPLCLDYGWTHGGSTAQMLGSALPALIVVCGLVGATVWAICHNSALGFLGAWFFLILAPTSSFVPLADPIFEHRMYLPLASVVTIAVLGTCVLSGRLHSGQLLGRILGVSVVLMLMGLTVRRNLDYASELSIWLDTVNKRPNNARAHNNLAAALGQAGSVEEAIRHYEQALRIKPDYAEAHNNLGVALGGLGKFEDAIGHFEHALHVAPDYAEAHYNLGLALEQTGKVQEAIEQYTQALRIKPDIAKAHYHLGIALERAGEVREAIEQYKQALQLKPDYAEAHNNLGLALLHAGKTAEAIQQLEQALQVSPTFFEALCNLGDAMLHNGRAQESFLYLEQAVRVNSNSALAQYKLGNAFSQTGKTQDAIHHYEQALRLDPNYAMAQNDLAWTLATLSPLAGGDPTRAVVLAERASDSTGHRDAAYLDTLAAACAADGRFNEAIDVAEKAVGLARTAGQHQLVGEIETRLKSYHAGKAWREPMAHGGN